MDFLVLLGFFLTYPLTIFSMMAKRLIGCTPPWRALHLTAIALLLFAMAVIYLGAIIGNRNMDDIMDRILLWNPLLDGNGFGMRGGESLLEYLLEYWVMAGPILVYVSVLLGALEYLDLHSGLELLERLKKLFSK